MTPIPRLLLPALLAFALPVMAESPDSAMSQATTSHDSAAEAASTAGGGKVVDFGTTRVLGTRRERPLREIAQKTQIVTRDDIERTPANDISDVLKKTASIDVIQYPGLLAGVGFRGFRPQYSGHNQRTLLLVDGRPAGATNYATVGLFDIERIEVTKGPSSSLYGPQAMGGAINIVTTEKIRSPYVELGVGSFGRVDGAFGYGHRDSTGWFWDVSSRLSQQSRETRIGRSHLLDDWGILDGNETKTEGTDGSWNAVLDTGDGMRRLATTYEEAQGAFTLGWARDGWLVKSRWSVYDAPSCETPGDIAKGNAGNGLKNVERYNADILASLRLGDHKLSLQGYRSREFSENWQVAANYRNNETTLDWTGIQLRDNWMQGPFAAVLGGDWSLRESETRRYSSGAVRIAPYNPDYQINDVATYAEVSAKTLGDRLVATVGGRWDRITLETLETDLLDTHKPGERSSDVVSPSAGLVGLLPYGFRLHASTGRGFTTPDAYQIAGASVTAPVKGKVAVTKGNADLDPETNWMFDGGAGFARSEWGLSLDATAYRNIVEDRIVSRIVRRPVLALEFVGKDTVASRTTYVNADESETVGIELSGSFDIGRPLGWRRSLRLLGNASIIVESEEKNTIRSADGLRDSTTETLDGKNVGDNWSAGLEFEQPDLFAARLSSRYIGRRKDTDWNDPAYPEIDYAAFLVTDLSVGVTVAPRTDVNLSVANITDENYYEKRGYNMPGRNWRLALRRTF